MSLLRLEGVVREVGTFVILDGVTASMAPGERVGLVGPNGAGKTTLLRIAAGQDEPDRGIAARKRGLSLGLLGQEAHFDEAFMAAPDLRSAVRHGAAHLERMAEELGRLEHEGHAAGTDYADLQHRFDILGGYTLDQRVDEALSGLGSRATSGPGRRPRSRAASRPARPSPGSSSPTRTCSCSTSRRTTWTSARSSGWRSTCAAAPGRCSSPPTIARSSTRPCPASGSCATAA